MLAPNGNRCRMIRWRRCLVALVTSMLLVTPACSKLRHPFSSGAKTRTGTLVIEPLTGRIGTAFALNAGGFRPGEPMTFEVDIPNHPKFVGPPHNAGPDGSVKSSYTPLTGDPPGVYQVKAVGSQGTHAEATLTVTG